MLTMMDDKYIIFQTNCDDEFWNTLVNNDGDYVCLLRAIKLKYFVLVWTNDMFRMQSHDINQPITV